MSKERIMLNCDTWPKLSQELGWPRYQAYFALTEHLWKGEDLPDSDDQLAKLARISVDQWLEYKPDVLPKVVDHDDVWFWASEKEADDIMEQQAVDAAGGGA